MAGIVAQSASTRANVSQNKSKRSKRVKWTKEEVHALQEGVRQYGEGRWAVILREFASSFHSCRISVDLKDKWRNLFKTHRGGGQQVEIEPLHNQQRVQTESPQMVRVAARPPSQERQYLQRADLMKQNAVFTVPPLDRTVSLSNIARVIRARHGGTVSSDGTMGAPVSQGGAQRQDLTEVKKETFHVHPSDTVEFAEAAHHGDDATEGVHSEHPLHYEEVEAPAHELADEVEAQPGGQDEGAVVVEHFQQDQQSQSHAQEPNADQNIHAKSANYAEQLPEQHEVADGSRVAQGGQNTVQQQLLHVECEVPEQSEVNAQLATGVSDTNIEQHADEERPAVDPQDTFCEQDIVHEEQVVHEEHVGDENHIVHDEDVIEDGDVVHEEDFVQESQTGHEAHVHHADDVTEDGQVIHENSAEGDGNSEMTHTGTIATVSPMTRVEINGGHVDNSEEPEQPVEPCPAPSKGNMVDLQRRKQRRIESVNRDHCLLRPPHESECAQERGMSVGEKPNAHKTNCELATDFNQCIDSDAHEDDGEIQNSLVRPSQRNQHDEQTGHRNSHGAGGDQHIVDNGNEIQVEHVEHGDVSDHPGLSSEMERVVEVEDEEHILDERYADDDIDEEQCEHESREQTHRGEHEYYEEEEEGHDGVHQDYEEDHDTHEDLEHVHYEDDEDEEQPLEHTCHEEGDFETIEHDQGGECIANEGVTHETHITDLDRASRNANAHGGELELEPGEQVPAENLDHRTVMNTGYPAELRRMDDVKESSGITGRVAGSEKKKQAQKPNFDECDSISCQVKAPNASKLAEVEGQGPKDLHGESRASEDRGESFPQEKREPVQEAEEVGDGSCGTGCANVTTDGIVEDDARMKPGQRNKLLDQETTQGTNYHKVTIGNEAANRVTEQGRTAKTEKDLTLQSEFEQSSTQVDQQQRMNEVSSLPIKSNMNVGDRTGLGMQKATTCMEIGLEKKTSGQEIEDADVGADQVAVGELFVRLDFRSRAKVEGTVSEEAGEQSTEPAEPAGIGARIKVERGMEEIAERRTPRIQGTKREREEFVLGSGEIERAGRRQRTGGVTMEARMSEEK